MLVKPNGDVLPCHAANVLPGMTFENVEQRSLRQIWEESAAFQKFRGVDWMPELCRTCDRREQDFGGCRCQAFLLARDAAATDPVCTLSPQRGIVDAIIREVNAAAPEPPSRSPSGCTARIPRERAHEASRPGTTSARRYVILLTVWSVLLRRAECHRRPAPHRSRLADSVAGSFRLRTAKGEEFKAPARTLLINRGGAVIILDQELAPEQFVHLQRRAPHESHRKGQVRVVGRVRPAKGRLSSTASRCPTRPWICGAWNSRRSRNPPRPWPACCWNAPTAAAAKWCT